MGTVRRDRRILMALRIVGSLAFGPELARDPIVRPFSPEHCNFERRDCIFGPGDDGPNGRIRDFAAAPDPPDPFRPLVRRAEVHSALRRSRASLHHNRRLGRELRVGEG